MKLHGNARLTPHGRTLMCRRVRIEGWTIAEASAAAGCSERTCYRWLVRFDAGEPLTDRSSAPHSVPGRTPPETEALIEQLRRLRFTSTRIAADLDLPCSTVCAVLRRIGLHRLSRLEPPEPPNRYCRRHPGELIHIDIKKLGRFNQPGLPAHLRQAGYKSNRSPRVGWDVVHVAIDDTSRLAYVEILDDEKAVTAIGFLRRAIAYFASLPDSFGGDAETAAFTGQVEWFGIERDDPSFFRFLIEVASVLDADEPPPASTTCSGCRWKADSLAAS